MIPFVSFGDSGLAYPEIDQQMVLAVLTKLFIFIVVLAGAGLAFLIALITAFVFSANKAVRYNSLPVGLSLLLRSMFFIVVFFFTLLISLIAMVFIKTLSWWMVLGIGLGIGLLFAIIITSVIRIFFRQIAKRVMLFNRASDILHRLYLLIGSYINK